MSEELNDESTLPRAMVQQSVAELLLRIKQRLEAIPEQLADQFPFSSRADLETCLSKKIYSILLEMSAWEIGPPEEGDDQCQ